MNRMNPQTLRYIATMQELAHIDPTQLRAAARVLLDMAQLFPEHVPAVSILANKDVSLRWAGIDGADSVHGIIIATDGSQSCHWSFGHPSNERPGAGYGYGTGPDPLHNPAFLESFVRAMAAREQRGVNQMAQSQHARWYPLGEGCGCGLCRANP